MVSTNRTILSMKTLQEKVDKTNWEAEDQETRYLSHSIHRYSGKFIPFIARSVIELVSQEGETILDPYMGSGTTVLEALLLKRIALGVDMNPLGVLISKVKTTPVNTNQLHKVLDDFHYLCNKLNPTLNQGLLFNNHNNAIDSIFNSYLEDDRWNDPWYKKWFNDGVRRQLIILSQFIDAINNPDIQNIAKVSFSDILRRCSNAHQGYPNVMFDKNHQERPLPSSLFIKRLNEIAQSLVEMSEALRHLNKAIIKEGDATNLSFIKCNSIDAIVTHPPYIGSVPYAEYGVLSLTWLGHDSKELDKILTGGKRQTCDVVERFELGFNRMIKESFRVLKNNSILFMLVGNPLVKGKRIDLSEMSSRLAKKEGFALVAQAFRSGVNRRANKMGKESLLFFKKA